MKKITAQTVLLFFTFLAYGQDLKYVDTETLNIRENAGKQYNVVGKVKKGDKVSVISETDTWTQIKTENNVEGYVATKYLISDNTDSNINSKKEESTFLRIFLGLGLLGYLGYKAKKFISGLFGGFLSSSRSQRSTPTKKQEVRRKSSNSAVYRFRIKGNGFAGGFQYVDGMNVEVAVKGLGANGSPFNNIVEKLFVQEIARKYNVEPRFHSGIKMLFKRDNLDVEIM